VQGNKGCTGKGMNFGKEGNCKSDAIGGREETCLSKPSNGEILGEGIDNLWGGKK